MESHPCAKGAQGWGTRHLESCIRKWARCSSRHRIGINPPTHEIKIPTLSRRTRQGWGTRRKAECPLFARRFVRLSSTEGFLGQTHVIAGKQVVALHDLGVGNIYYAGNLGFGIAE